MEAAKKYHSLLGPVGNDKKLHCREEGADQHCVALWAVKQLNEWGGGGRLEFCARNNGRMNARKQ